MPTEVSYTPEQLHGQPGQQKAEQIRLDATKALIDLLPEIVLAADENEEATLTVTIDYEVKAPKKGKK